MSSPTSGTSSLSSSLSNFELSSVQNASSRQQPQQLATEKRSQAMVTPRTPREVTRAAKPPRTPREFGRASSPEKMAVREIVLHPLHNNQDQLRTPSSPPATLSSPSPLELQESRSKDATEAEKIRKLEFIARSEQEGRILLERKLEEAKTVHHQLRVQLEDVKQALAAQHTEAVDKQILIQQEIQRWAGEFEDLRTLVILGNQAQTKMQNELEHHRHAVECREAEIKELMTQLADRDQDLQEMGMENERLRNALGEDDKTGELKGKLEKDSIDPEAKRRDGGASARGIQSASFMSPQVLQTTPRTPPVFPDKGASRYSERKFPASYVITLECTGARQFSFENVSSTEYTGHLRWPRRKKACSTMLRSFFWLGEPGDWCH